MPRIAIAECKQEVSTFNPALTHYEDFDVLHGDDIVQYHRNVRNEIGGALSIFDQRQDVLIVPVYSARAITSGGTLDGADFRRIASEWVTCLAEVGHVDAAYFSLHGAMASTDEDDPEGFLLAETRRVVGEDIPIVVSYDLHGILTDRMLQHADASVVYQTYPHVDFFETGERSARLLLRILDGEARPVTAKVFIPALVRGDELITATGLIGHAVHAARDVEQSREGLSAGIFWGNPFTDVSALGTNAMVSTNGDEALASKHALHIADLFWQHHAKMRVPLTSLTDAVGRARESAGTTILVDAADATSSGASGDSNAILNELIAQKYTGSALIPIVDPPAVHSAFEAGVGAVITTRVGGAVDIGRYKPTEIQARVRMLSDGAITSESYGEQWNAGRTAVLQFGLITLIITSRAVSLYDRSLFYAHGQDLARFGVVVVKSPHCQPHMYREWAAQYINVDAPGSSSANLNSLGHTHCSRPIFPLDPNVEFVPKARLFRRHSRG